MQIKNNASASNILVYTVARVQACFYFGKGEEKKYKGMIAGYCKGITLSFPLSPVSLLLRRQHSREVL